MVNVWVGKVITKLSALRSKLNEDLENDYDKFDETVQPNVDCTDVKTVSLSDFSESDISTMDKLCFKFLTDRAFV